MDARLLEWFRRPEFKPLEADFWAVYRDLYDQGRCFTSLDQFHHWRTCGVMAVERDHAYTHLRSRLSTQPDGSQAVLLHCAHQNPVDNTACPPFVILGYDTTSHCPLAIKWEVNLGPFIRRMAAHRWAERAGASLAPVVGAYISPPGQEPCFIVATTYALNRDVERAIHKKMMAQSWECEAVVWEVPPPAPCGVDVLAMCLGMFEQAAGLHHASIVHNDIKPRNYVCPEFGNKEAVKMIDPASAWPACSTGHFNATCREACNTIGYASPKAVIHEEGGKHNDVFGLGMVLYSLAFAGRVGDEATNQRFRFSSPLKLWMLERYLQSGEPMCNEYTAALGFEPEAVHLLAYLILIMGSSGPHCPALDWCCEFLSRIHFAALLRQQGRTLEYCQLLAETFAFSWEPAPALYEDARVYPGRQLEDASQHAHMRAMAAVIERYQQAATHEPYTHAVKLKTFSRFNPKQILMNEEMRLSALKVVADGNGMQETAHASICQEYDAAEITMFRDYTNCPIPVLQAVAGEWKCSPSEIIMHIEIGYQPWAPSRLLERAKAVEQLLEESKDAQAAGQALNQEADGAAEEVNMEFDDGEFDHYAAAAAAAELEGARQLVRHGSQQAEAASGMLRQPAGVRRTQAEHTDQQEQQVQPHAQKRARRQGLQQRAPHDAALDNPAAAPAAAHGEGRLEAVGAAALEAAAAQPGLAVGLRDAFIAAVVTGAPADPAKTGLLLQTTSGSWRAADATPWKGPGVYLFTIKPFGQDRKQPEPAEYRLPNGFGKNRAASNTLRRITFLYSRSGNPAFSNIEQHAAAQVLERGLLVCLRRAAYTRLNSGPLYLGLPLACAVPEAQRGNAPQLNPAHHPVVFQFVLKPSSGLGWQQAAVEDELWAGTRPPILSKLVERPLFDSSMLRAWLLQAAFEAPEPGLNWRQHNALGASRWCAAVKVALATLESLLRLPVCCSDRYCVGGVYAPADWEELPLPA